MYESRLINQCDTRKNRELMSVAMEKITVGGIPVVRIGRNAFTRKIIEHCGIGKSYIPYLSFSANGQVIALANRCAEYKSDLLQADYIDADGMSLVIASRFLGKKSLPERMATTDLFHDIAKAASDAGVSFFFLGGTPTVSQCIVVELRKMYPNLIILGAHHGFFSEDEIDTIASQIESLAPNILWIGMGTPKQERLAIILKSKLTSVHWIKTCGGLFDHILGTQPRAAAWMQASGLEWLHRLRMEPRRLFLRYLTTNPVAMWYLITKTKSKI